MLKTVLFSLAFLPSLIGWSQNHYWQQRVEYKIDVQLDVNSDKMNGDIALTYHNNSSDTLFNAFFHLYYNAFQPGSAMDIRSRTIQDPDRRVRDRISKLKPNEIGFHKIKKLTLNETEVPFIVEGTIVEASLPKPILPKSKAQFYISFESQVPVQIRRTGRDNKEGVEYSMSQWFPKIAEYDEKGWHTHPYVGREFYSPWGDYDVNITLDKNYIIGGTGVLKNADEIGYGYSSKQIDHSSSSKLTWNFVATDVHDFVWAADPDFVHSQIKVDDELTVHFLYQGDTLVSQWKDLMPQVKKTFEIANEKFGRYPYPVYSVIQGGDGGMEYPMATLITGHRSPSGLLGVAVHEIMHSWYQMLLATNESYYAWMDEGFTSFAEATIIDEMSKHTKKQSLVNRGYSYYFRLAKSGKEEPLSTHADHFTTNFAYGAGAYGKGAIALAQLQYVLGQETFNQSLKSYFNQWKFKHPDLNDFVRVLEKTSGLELDWYFEYWVNSTHTIDYSIKQLEPNGNKTKIMLEKIGVMPMPVDLEVISTSGDTSLITIPIDLMRGNKKCNNCSVGKDWPWVYPYYELEVDIPLKKIEKITIDPNKLMADINRTNNTYPYQGSTILR